MKRLFDREILQSNRETRHRDRDRAALSSREGRNCQEVLTRSKPIDRNRFRSTSTS
jgi:hypothetical protein